MRTEVVDQLAYGRTQLHVLARKRREAARRGGAVGAVAVLAAGLKHRDISISQPQYGGGAVSAVAVLAAGLKHRDISISQPQYGVGAVSAVAVLVAALKHGVGIYQSINHSIYRRPVFRSIDPSIHPTAPSPSSPPA